MATTDELRKAAERLAEFARIASQGTPGQAPAYWDAAYMAVYNGTPHTRLGDMTAVSAAVLGPADDVEPVTADRLQAAGFHGLLAGGLGIDVGYDSATLVADGPHWALMSNDGDVIAVRTPTNMGHVRRLLAGLGVPTTPAGG